MGDQNPFGLAREHRDTKTQQQVFEDDQVVFNSLAAHLALARYFRQVQQLTVGQTDGLQEAGKRADLAGQGFGLNLLMQVERGIGAQCVFRLEGAPDQGHEPDFQGPLQVKRLAKFCCHEGMHLLFGEPPGQQVGCAPTQLAGTRSRQDEPQWTVALHKLVHNIQQCRYLLHFVNHHVGEQGLCRDAFQQSFRSGLEQAQGLRIKQVDPDGRVEQGPQPGRLARAAWPEQEKTAGMNL